MKTPLLPFEKAPPSRRHRGPGRRKLLGPRRGQVESLPAERPEADPLRPSPLPWESAAEPTLDRLRRTFEPLSGHSQSDPSAAGSGAPEHSMLRPRF